MRSGGKTWWRVILKITHTCRSWRCGHSFSTCVMRVLQVEQSRPLLLPDLPLLLDLLLVVVEFLVAGGLLCGQALLKPHLPQKHVQGERAHHKARVEGEPGPEGLHAGPAARLAVSRFNSAGAGGDTGTDTEGTDKFEEL